MRFQDRGQAVCIRFLQQPSRIIHVGGGHTAGSCPRRVLCRVYETYRTTDRGNEAGFWSYGLLDRTVFGRQEPWEDSPQG